MNNYDEYYNDINDIRYQQKKVNNLIIEQDPYYAFIKGNLFNNLYIPYKDYKVAQINPKNEEEYLMLMIQIYDFCAHELTLYLDVNPNDQEAIRLRTEYINLAKQALNEYESQYKALNLTSSNLATIPWAWDTKKWPWEGNK